uniref:Uncharacterized protein n=1 Tax=Anopheles dirus TaxID=7168 RepID=A0A182NRS7_9DIPT
MQQQLQPRARTTTDGGNGVYGDTPVPTVRPTSSFAAEHPRRVQGRGRPRQDHPIARLSGGDGGLGDGTETDGDIDDTLSEFAAGWYTPRQRTPSRCSTMRPSTLKKLNQWFDSVHEERVSLGKGAPSMADLRRVRVETSEEEEDVEEKIEEKKTPNAEPVEEQPMDGKQDPETSNKEQTDSMPQTVVAEIKSPRNSSTGLGFYCLKQLMLVMIYLAKLLLPRTLTLLTYLRDNLTKTLHYLWNRFYRPSLEDPAKTREDDRVAIEHRSPLPTLFVCPEPKAILECTIVATVRRAEANIGLKFKELT